MKIIQILLSFLLMLSACAPSPTVQESQAPRQIPVIDASGDMACIASWQVTPKDSTQLFAIYYGTPTSDGSYSQFNLREAVLLLQNSEDDMQTGLCAYSIVFGLNAGPLPGLEVFNDMIVEHQLTTEDLRCRE